MRTFAVNEILGTILSSRPLARDLRAYVDNSGETDAIIDFTGIRFASRGFMDEFYNLFLTDKPAKIMNMPTDLCVMLESVKATQYAGKPAPKTTEEYHVATDFEDMDRWFAKMAI